MEQFAQGFIYPAVNTRVMFGLGMLAQLPEVVSGFSTDRVLLVTDAGLQASGILDQVRQVLHSGNIKVEVYDAVPQDSSTTAIEQAWELLDAFKAKLVIGVGGGSSLDFAKAVAVRATNPPPLKQYAGLDKVVNRPLPVIAVPTTSGTGSEVSFWSIMTDDETHVKIAIGGDLLFPSVALCDPELTLGLPPKLTAATGMDALAHAIESYTNKSFQPISSVLTLKAVELIGRYLVRAVEDGSDREARYGMMLGSTLAGMGMNPTRLGLVHALAMPLGSWNLKIPHGIAVATLLAEAMEFNVIGNPEIFAKVAQALGVEIDGLDDIEAGNRGVQVVREIAHRIGIPDSLASYGLHDETIPLVCAEAMKSGNIAANPRNIVQVDLERICKALAKEN